MRQAASPFPLNVRDVYKVYIAVYAVCVAVCVLVRVAECVAVRVAVYRVLQCVL